MKALDVAGYVVTKCINDNKPISNLQLQKILYYIQHEILKKHDIALIDEDFQAWKFGPAIPIVYYEYSYCGASKIHQRLNNFEDVEFELEELLEDIDPIIEEKREIDPWGLVDETHKPGKAWAVVFKEGKGFMNIIPKEQIKNAAF